MVLVWTKRRGPCLALGSVAWLVLGALAQAGVTSSTDQHSFVVGGTTAAGIVRFMNSHAVSGDHGNAYASIHPHYQLSLTTRQNGGMCRADRVDVHVDFDLTLPVAADAGSMGRTTRSAWNNFTAFARNHEAHHKASYLGCASSFVVEAKQQSAPSCFELGSDIRQMLNEMRRTCEARQIPFDRSQSRVLRNLRLFSMARYQRN